MCTGKPGSSLSQNILADICVAAVVHIDHTFLVASYISTIKCFTRRADILGNPEHMAPTRRLNDVSPSDAKEKGSMCSTTIITNACSSTLITRVGRQKTQGTYGASQRREGAERFSRFAAYLAPSIATEVLTGPEHVRR